MQDPEIHEVTRLLQGWKAGDRAALELLVPLVYSELRRLARHYMHGEGKGHILQTTALINEAFIRLLDLREVDWANRQHFVATAALLMRRILVDCARQSDSAKRGGRAERINLSGIVLGGVSRGVELLALDEALNALEVLDSRKARVVELRFFGGFGIEEAASALGVSPETVQRDWRFAKAWLYDRLQETNKST